MNIVKLNGLSRWKLLPRGEAIHFAEKPGGDRRVKLLLNSQFDIGLWFRNADGEERFLAALCPGLNEVEFFAAGPFAIVPSDGENELWYISTEAEPAHVVIKDPVIYTGIAQRRQRNPQLEAIMYVMRQNQRENDAKLAAQADLFADQLAKLKQEKPNGETGVHEPTSKKPAKPRVDAGRADKPKEKAPLEPVSPASGNVNEPDQPAGGAPQGGDEVG